MEDNEVFEFEDSELDPPKPYTAEQQETINEINSEIADLSREICEMG